MDNQKIANTGGISNDALHIEMSEARKLIKNNLNTTPKNVFCLPIANQSDGKNDQWMEIQWQGQRKCPKRRSCSDH